MLLSARQVNERGESRITGGKLSHFRSHTHHVECWKRRPTDVVVDPTHDLVVLKHPTVESEASDWNQGGGNISTDTCHIVDNDEHPQDQLVIKVQLGKGQGLSHKASQALAEGQVPSLDMGRLAALLADGVMFAGCKDLLVGIPEIAKGMAPSVGFGDSIP